MRQILFFAILSLILSCGGPEQSKPQATKPSPPPVQPKQQAPVTQGETYPSITQEQMTKVFKDAESLDFIFYNLPISMNVDEKAGVQQLLSFISTSPAPKNYTCKPTGRLSFQSQGEFILEADFFVENGCSFYLFKDKSNKTIAGNLLTEKGVSYFKNLTSNLPKTAPKQ